MHQAAMRYDYLRPRQAPVVHVLTLDVPIHPLEARLSSLGHHRFLPMRLFPFLIINEIILPVIKNDVVQELGELA